MHVSVDNRMPGRPTPRRADTQMARYPGTQILRDRDIDSHEHIDTDSMHVTCHVYASQAHSSLIYTRDINIARRIDDEDIGMADMAADVDVETELELELETDSHSPTNPSPCPMGHNSKRLDPSRAGPGSLRPLKLVQGTVTCIM